MYVSTIHGRFSRYSQSTQYFVYIMKQQPFCSDGFLYGSWQPELHRRHGEAPCCHFYAMGIFTGKEPNRKSEKPFGGAAGRNRTAISWLEARRSADELQPRVSGRSPSRLFQEVEKMNSNQSYHLARLGHDTILHRFFGSCDYSFLLHRDFLQPYTQISAAYPWRADSYIQPASRRQPMYVTASSTPGR